jgi:hypothetical protein
VPKKILVNEMLPKFKKNKDYFTENKYPRVGHPSGDPQEVDPRDVPWKRVDEDTFPTSHGRTRVAESARRDQVHVPERIRRVLHDTPARRYFTRNTRFLSHGCVRVQDPLALATYLLQETPLAAPESLAASWRTARGGESGSSGACRCGGVPHRLGGRAGRAELPSGRVRARPQARGGTRERRVLDFDINPLVLRNPLMPAQTNWAAPRIRH